jgi:hypothetical protein
MAFPDISLRDNGAGVFDIALADAPVTGINLYQVISGAFVAITNAYVIVSGSWIEADSASVIVSGSWRSV